eukprot:42322_1
MTSVAELVYVNPPPTRNNNQHLKICIIGAGVCGLCTGKHLLEYGFKNITIFEQHDETGGVWLYKKDPNFPNAMYPTLHTNFATSFMKFPDFSFQNKTESHPPYTAIYEYLQSYIKHFNLKQYIKTNHKVVNIEPPKNDTKWKVQYIVTNTNMEIKHETLFDFVIICNGHFRHRRFPTYIDGFNDISTPYMHSQSYRGPIKSFYRNKTILLIGSGNTASDIVQDLVPLRICSKIYHASSVKNFQYNFANHRTKVDEYKDCYILKPRIKSFDNKNNKIIFNNDEYIYMSDIDLIIFATGYDFNFEFIDFTLDNNKKLYYLYEHMFCAYYPSLIYMSIPIGAIALWTAHFQSIWLCKILCDMNLKGIGDKMEIISKYLPLKQKMINESTNKNNDHIFKGTQLFDCIDIICDNAQIVSPVNEMKRMFQGWFSKRIVYLIQNKIFIPDLIANVVKSFQNNKQRVSKL